MRYRNVSWKKKSIDELPGAAKRLVTLCHPTTGPSNNKQFKLNRIFFYFRKIHSTLHCRTATAIGSVQAFAVRVIAGRLKGSQIKEIVKRVLTVVRASFEWRGSVSSHRLLAICPTIAGRSGCEGYVIRNGNASEVRTHRNTERERDHSQDRKVNGALLLF